MATINGNIYDSFAPVSFANSAKSLSKNWRNNYLVSANVPKRYQIRWDGLNEAETPSKSNGTSSTGDVINMVFYVYATTRFEDGVYPTNNANWDLVATIKKSRDIANRKYNDGTPPSGHRFTVDISRLLSDEITYSLCPIKKGTWQSAFYGGMNGGLTMQDNVLDGNGAMGSPISDYNVSRNGSFRNVKVKTYYEVINGDGQIVSASGNSKTSDLVTVINSVNQFDKDVVYYNNKFSISETVPSTDSHGFMSRCPNHNNSTTPNFSKEVRMDDEAEWLYWFQRRVGVGSGSSSSNQVSRIRLHCRNSDGVTFYLKEFASRLRKPSNYGFLQNRVCVQNVSPAYINENNGTTYTNATDTSENPLTVAAYPNGLITASTNHYRIYIQYVAAQGGAVTRHTHYRHYTIDREDEKNPYAFVKFHWLNSVGGIDSYTAKRDVVEGLTISRDVIERKSADRTWYQNDTNDGTLMNDSLYHSDTMRGGDIYKGGREVSNVNAERTQSVYTEPLNQLSAKWLEEIMLSPNVWIEKDTDATAQGNKLNPYLRPSTKEYIPVIITNSDIETVNQAEGLVKFNIEYTFAHKLITQRN